MFNKKRKNAQRIKDKLKINFEKDPENSYYRIKSDMLKNATNKSEANLQIDAIKMLIKEKCSAKPKFYGLMILRDLMELNDPHIVKHFATKITERLVKILTPAVQKSKVQLQQTCLDRYYKTDILPVQQQKQNREYSQKFYILLLQCWINWDKQFSKQNQIIAKRADKIRQLFDTEYKEDLYSFMNESNTFQFHLPYVQQIPMENDHKQFDEQSDDESFGDYKSDNQVKRNSQVQQKKVQIEKIPIQDIQKKHDQLQENLQLFYMIFSEIEDNNYNDSIETLFSIRETILQTTAQTPTLDQIIEYTQFEGMIQLLKEAKFMKDQETRIKSINYKEKNNKQKIQNILKSLQNDFKNFYNENGKEGRIRESTNFDLYDNNTPRQIDQNSDFKKRSQDQFQKLAQNFDGSEIHDAVNDFENGGNMIQKNSEEDMDNFQNFDGFQNDFEKEQIKSDEKIFNVNHFKDNKDFEMSNFEEDNKHEFDMEQFKDEDKEDFNVNHFKDVKNEEFEQFQNDDQDNEDEQYNFQNFEDTNKQSSKGNNQYLGTIQEVEETYMDSQYSSYKQPSKNNDQMAPLFKNPLKKSNVFKRHTTDNVTLKKRSEPVLKIVNSQKNFNDELENQFNDFGDFDDKTSQRKNSFDKVSKKQKSPVLQKEDFEFNFGNESSNDIKNQKSKSKFTSKIPNESMDNDEVIQLNDDDNFQMGKFTFKGQSRENKFQLDDFSDKKLQIQDRKNSYSPSQNNSKYKSQKVLEDSTPKKVQRKETVKDQFDQFDQFDSKDYGQIAQQKVSQSINPPLDNSKTEDDLSDIVEDQKQTNQNIQKTLENISKYSMRRSSIHLNKDVLESEYKKPDFDNTSDKFESQGRYKQQKIDNVSNKRGVPSSVVSYKSKIQNDNFSAVSKHYIKNKSNISQNDMQSEFDDLDNKQNFTKQTIVQEFDVDRDKIKFLEEEVHNLTEQLKRAQIKQMEQEEELDEDKDYVSLNILRRKNTKLAQQNEYLQKLKDDLKFEKEKMQKKVSKEKHIYKSLINQYDMFTNKLKSELEMEKAKNLKRSAFIDKLQTKLKDYDDKLTCFKQSYHQLKQNSMIMQQSLPKENIRASNFEIQQEEPKIYINHQSLIQAKNLNFTKKQNMTQSLIPKYQAMNIVQALESQRQSVISNQKFQNETSNQNILPQKSQQSLNMYEQFFKQLNSQKIRDSQIENQNFKKYTQKELNFSKKNVKVQSHNKPKKEQDLNESIKDLVVDDEIFNMLNERENNSVQISNKSILNNESQKSINNGKEDYVNLKQFSLYKKPQFLLFLKASSLFDNSILFDNEYMTILCSSQQQQVDDDIFIQIELRYQPKYEQGCITTTLEDEQMIDVQPKLEAQVFEEELYQVFTINSMQYNEIQFPKLEINLDFIENNQMTFLVPIPFSINKFMNPMQINQEIIDHFYEQNNEFLNCQLVLNKDIIPDPSQLIEIFPQIYVYNENTLLLNIDFFETVQALLEINIIEGESLEIILHSKQKDQIFIDFIRWFFWIFSNEEFF